MYAWELNVGYVYNLNDKDIDLISWMHIAEYDIG